MSEVFIPLGGAGGKNRGEGVQVDENYTYLKAGNSGVALPLPAGNYKAMKAVHGEESLFASYGDGKNAAVFMTKEFLKKVTLDLFGIASITNFSLTMYAHRQVRLTWAKPSEGLWSGVHFVFKYGSMPTSETDGFMQIDSADVYYTTDRLQETDLYVRAYSYVTVKDGRWYDDGAVSSHIRVTGINGAVTLSAGAGVWTVPDGVRRIRYILVGHGGAGGSGNGYYVPGGGGGGGCFTTGYMDVTPGQAITWIVPVRGQVAPDNTAAWRKLLDGAALPELYTTFGGIVAKHGKSPLTMQMSRKHLHFGSGGDGGSGGAAFGGYPGINGNDGSGAQGYVRDGEGRDADTYYLTIRPGQGQHSSTTGFNGVLYCNGGNAGASAPALRGSKGTDGLGNGGNGSSHNNRDAGYGGGEGGTGCIYIAWGSLMNDGS